MILDSHTGLVLEGGGMRGVFTAGALDFLEQLEREKKVILIRPEKPLEVDRIEQDVTKLTDLYNQGYECARKVFSI